MIFGETFCSGAMTSVEVVRKMVMNEFTFGYPTIRFNCVDVKDCSIAHLRALEIPEAANKRFILSLREDHALIDLANVVYDDLRNKGYNYPMYRKAVGYCSLKFASYFSSDAASILPLCNKPSNVYINDRSRQILGIEYKKTT